MNKRDKEDKRKGIDIVKQPESAGISLVGGGIRIDASGKPVEAHFEQNWGRVYMVLDCSGSMAGYKIDQAKQGVLDFTKDAIRKKYLVGLIKFDTNATYLAEPTKDVSRLEAQMKSIMASGTTNMAEAIKMAHESLKNLGGSRVMVIATDGQPDNADDSLNEGKSAKRDGIEIITIGTDDAVQEFLKKLASRSDLGAKVSTDMFAKAISSAYLFLPSPTRVIPKQK
jgi:Mg-chelatase subunit ChlD